MATTTPDNIYSPDAGQQYALTQDLLATADSIQNALSGLRAGTVAVSDKLTGAPLIRRRFMSGENPFTNITSFSGFPNSADATALTGTLAKTRSSTRLIARMSGSAVLRSGTTQPMFLGLNINGTDYEVARFQFPEATNRSLMVGEIEISGVPAGSLTISPRFKGGSASIVSFYFEDYVNYSVQEMP